MIYLDSSAIVKLARQESETAALRGWLATNPAPLTASTLVRTEAARALTRSQPDALPVLRSVLALLHLSPITDLILEAAATPPDPDLRSLDAIHLATAEHFAPALTWFVAYDKRLAEAARSRGLPVAAPA